MKCIIRPWNLLTFLCSPSSWSSWLYTTMKWLLKTHYGTSQVAIPCRTGTRFSRRLYRFWISIQPHNQGSWARIQRVEMRAASLIIAHNGPIAMFLFPVPMTLCSADLEVLVPKGRMLSPGNIMIPLNWKWRLPLGHFEFSCLWINRKNGSYKSGWSD